MFISQMEDLNVQRIEDFVLSLDFLEASFDDTQHSDDHKPHGVVIPCWI